MLYFLDSSYSSEDCFTKLSYFGTGDGPRFCGEKKERNELSGMLKFEKGVLCDFIYIKPGVMACTGKAKDAIGEKVKKEVQFFPITVNDIDLFVMNIINVVDALDHEHSAIKYLPDGRIMKVSPCVIDEKKVADSFFFKIPENACKAFFGTEKLKKMLENSGLVGLRFMPLPATI